MTTFPLDTNKIKSINVDTDINVISNVEAISGKKEVILGDQIRQSIQLSTVPLTETEDRQFQVFLKQIKNYGLIEMPLSKLSVFKPINNTTNTVVTTTLNEIGATSIRTSGSNTDIETGSYVQFNNVDTPGPKKLHQVTDINSVPNTTTFQRLGNISSIESSRLIVDGDFSNIVSVGDTITSDTSGSNLVTVTAVTFVRRRRVYSFTFTAGGTAQGGQLTLTSTTNGQIEVVGLPSGTSTVAQIATALNASSNIQSTQVVGDNITVSFTENFGDGKVTLTLPTSTATPQSLNLLNSVGFITDIGVTGITGYVLSTNNIFVETFTFGTRDLIISPGLDTAIDNGTKINFTNLIGQFRTDNGNFNSVSDILLSDGTITKTYRFRLTEEL